jgi:hypothetical protein
LRISIRSAFSAARGRTRQCTPRRAVDWRQVAFLSFDDGRAGDGRFGFACGSGSDSSVQLPASS